MSLRPAARPLARTITALFTAHLGCTPTLLLPSGDAGPADAARPGDVVSAPDVGSAPDGASAGDVVSAPDVGSEIDVVRAIDAVTPVDVASAPDGVTAPDVVDAATPRDVAADVACEPGATRCGGACVSTATSVVHCGACDRACAPANAVPACVAGACRVERCNAGALDCDGEAANGCEARTASDPRNCGGCGIACGGAAVCTAGACQCNVATCAGRCTDLAVDANHCGACGFSCPAGVACANGRCGTLACAPSLTLCGARCANTLDDRAHCGACGRACDEGEVCARGACAPTPWQRIYGAGGDDAVTAVARDASGNLYVGGRYAGSINLGTTPLTGGPRGWIAKLNPSGNVLWSMVAGAQVFDIALDAAGQVYAVGNFNNTTTVGPRTLSAAGAYDWFAASWTPEGTVRWAVRQGGSGDDTARRVSVDAMGRVWVGGHFTTATNFDGQTVVARGNLDGFAAQLASADGAPLRFAQLAGTAYDLVTGIAAEPTDGATVYLRFGSSATVGTTTITGTAVCAALLRLGPDLSLRWHTVLTAASNLDAEGLARDASGNLYVAGEYAVGPVRVGTGSFGAGTFNGFVASVAPDGTYRWGITAADSSTSSSSSVVAESLSVAPDGVVFAEGWAQAPDLAVGALPVTLPAGRVRWVAGITPMGVVTSGRALTSQLNIDAVRVSAGRNDLVFVGSAIGPGTFDGVSFPSTTSRDGFVVRTPR